MSVIDRKPFINKVLESCSAADLETLRKYVNGDLSGDAFKSLVPQTLYALSPADKGISEITLEVYGQGQRLYHGYLVYNDDYCTLISFSGDKNSLLTMVDMDLEWYAEKGLWKFAIKSCELSILELRTVLFDIAKRAAIVYKGAISVEELNALEDMENGDLYDITNSGTVALGNFHVDAGDNVIWNAQENKWDKSASTIQLDYATDADVDAAWATPDSVRNGVLLLRDSDINNETIILGSNEDVENNVIIMEE